MTSQWMNDKVRAGDDIMTVVGETCNYLIIRNQAGSDYRIDKGKVVTRTNANYDLEVTDVGYLDPVVTVAHDVSAAYYEWMSGNDGDDYMLVLYAQTPVYKQLIQLINSYADPQKAEQARKSMPIAGQNYSVIYRYGEQGHPARRIRD